MSIDLVRIARADINSEDISGNFVVPYVVYGSNFIVHPKLLGKPFYLSEPAEINHQAEKILGKLKPRAFLLENNQVQFYTLPDEEILRAREVYERYFEEYIFGK